MDEMGINKSPRFDMILMRRSSWVNLLELYP
jgi:hypothetical protein